MEEKWWGVDGQKTIVCWQGKLSCLVKELPSEEVTSMVLPLAAGTLFLNTELENKLAFCSKQILMCR